MRAFIVAILAQITTAQSGVQLPIGPYTCGYYSGTVASPVTCSSPAACISFPSPTYNLPNFGCCGGNDVCYVSTCLDYGAASNPVSKSYGAVLGSAAFFCGTGEPYCTTVILYAETTTNGVRPSYLSYGCASQSGLTYTAYQGASPVSTSATPTTSTTSTSNQGARATSTSKSPTPTAQSSSGLSTGAEAGIGVGVGVGVIIFIVAIAVYFWRKRRRDRDQSSSQYEPYRSGNSSWYQDNARRDTTAWPSPPPSEMAAESRPKFGTYRSELSAERGVYEIGTK